jgi:hypothetical protein
VTTSWLHTGVGGLSFFQIWVLWKLTTPSLVNPTSTINRTAGQDNNSYRLCVYNAFCVTPLANHNTCTMVSRSEGLHLQPKNPLSLNTKFNVCEGNTNNSHQLVQRLRSLLALFQLYDQRMIEDHITQPVLLPLSIVQLLLGQALTHLPLLVPQHSAKKFVLLFWMLVSWKYIYDKDEP